MNKVIKMEKKDILIIISLSLLAFLIRAAGVSNVCIMWDEWLYWVTTAKIIAVSGIPTVKTFSGPSPFFLYIEAIVTELFGGDLNTLRMSSVFFGSLTVPFLYLFGKVMYDRKTGFLSALFLCFSAYHCLYSRIIMLEAFALFFVTAFLYFFWLSQRSDDGKNTTYAIIAGAMLGLAIAAKYLPGLLVPAILIYTLWTREFNFKALLDKKLLLTLVFALIFFSPMLIGFSISGANPMDFYITGRFGNGENGIGSTTERVEQGFGGGTPSLFISPDVLFVKAVETITAILAWGAEILTPLLAAFFKLSAFILFILSLFFYFHKFMKKEKEGSFLFISILVLYVSVAAFTSAAKYYFMYAFPLYFVMLSHFILKSIEHLRKENSYKNIFRIFAIFLVAIMLFSSFATGVTSPYWDEGEYSWVKSCTNYIKSDAAKSGYEGNITIGLTMLPGKVDYCLYNCDLDASTTRIIKQGGTYGDKVSIDLEKLDTLKPTYLIVSEAQYDILFKPDIKREILKNYDVVFHSKTFYLYNGLVLKRTDEIQSKVMSPMIEGGSISRDMFKRSVPSVMEVGKIYTALVRIENTGKFRTDFFVKVYPEGYVLFIEEPAREITLNKDSTCILKFKIVPITEYVGELPITVDFYAKSESGAMKKIDSVTDYVYLIKK